MKTVEKHIIPCSRMTSCPHAHIPILPVGWIAQPDPSAVRSDKGIQRSTCQIQLDIHESATSCRIQIQNPAYFTVPILPPVGRIVQFDPATVCDIKYLIQYDIA